MASLISREVIADSIELVAISHMFDGLVCIVGCDKTMPGAAMAIARVDIPSIAFYSGSIQPGTFRGKDVTVQDVFEAIGAYNAKQISAEDLHEMEWSRCRAPVRAGASSPPTRCRWRSSSSASRPPG